MSRPFHQVRTPAPVAKLSDGVDDAAKRVARRVKNYSRCRGHGCYLFVDDAGAVYVVGETASAARQWVVEHASWWCGCWDARGRRWHSASELVDAIRAELADYAPLKRLAKRASCAQGMTDKH